MADSNKLPPRARAKIFALADQEAAALTALNSNRIPPGWAALLNCRCPARI